MRSLSSTLTTAQKEISSPPIWKVVLSRSGQTTRGYDQSRVIKISHSETPNSANAEIVLHNADTTLTALDFEHYQAVISYGYNTGIARSAFVASSVYAVNDIVTPASTNGYQYRCSVAGTAGSAEPTWPTALGVTVANSAVTWEMDGNSGEEYSRTSPLRVRVQELHSGRGLLKVILRPEGILNQLGEDKAESVYLPASSAQDTVKTLITKIADATLTPYSNYLAYTVTYDSEDTLINTFKPGDYFSVNLNNNRLDKIQELLDYTGSKMRPEADGALHFLDPVISGTAYNYEYQFNVASEHNFWGKSVRLRFVNPNREIVKSPDEHNPSYAGTATSSTSYNLAPKIHTTLARLASEAEANSIASAKIERYELDAERGFLTVPMNVGQELWDYVKATDSRENDTRIGNIQYLQRDVEVYQDRKPLTWTMRIAFGKVTQQSLMANMLTSGVGGRGLTDNDIMNILDFITENINNLIDIQNGVLVYLKAREDYTIFKKVEVLEQLIIPLKD